MPVSCLIDASKMAESQFVDPGAKHKDDAGKWSLSFSLGLLSDLSVASQWCGASACRWFPNTRGAPNRVLF
jgi:hypothetical protein